MKLSEKVWTGIHQKYKTCSVLGQGTYGTVHLAERVERVPGKPDKVALKRCRLDLFNESGIPETTLREIVILYDMRHENVLRLHEISCNPSRLYLVCDYFQYDLKKFIRAHRKIPIDVCKRITHAALRGLAYCHGHRVIHRDLKPHNILLDSDARKVQLADFGLARGKVLQGKTLTQEVVTLWYRAPELLLGCYRYNESIDMWSMGCILAELITGRAVFPGDSEIDTLFKIFRLMGTPPKDQWPEESAEIKDQFPVFEAKENFLYCDSASDPLAKDLVLKMLRWRPSDRISAREALQHPWFGCSKICKKTRVVCAGTGFEAEEKKTFVKIKSSYTPKQIHAGVTGGKTAPPLRIRKIPNSLQGNNQQPIS